MHELKVALNERSYPIKIDDGLLDAAGSIIRAVNPGGKLMLVSNPRVFALYGQKTVDSLQEAGFKVRVVLMPDGEAYKNMEEALKIIEQGFAFGLERGSVLAALGGGVVGDLAGFVAAIYQRGIDFVQIPTTLLAQVDSSVGGKVAVNHPAGKNLIGAFHQPRAVIIDTAVLATLDERDYHSGLAEAYKYGIIYDAAFFHYLENHIEAICGRDRECLAHIIYCCCRIKSLITAEDEREEGLRAILNLGHTFGHALEQLTSYNVYRHGEAVALGMIPALYLALEEGLLTGAEADRILKLYQDTGLPVAFPDLAVEEIYQAMLKDKKVINGHLRLILPRHLGGYLISSQCPQEKILVALEQAKSFAARRLPTTDG